MTNPGGRSGDATMNNLWIFIALFGAPLAVIIWAFASHAIDEARNRTAHASHLNTSDSSDLYLRHESYNHYEDGEYRG